VPVNVGDDGRPAPVSAPTEQMAQRAARRRASFPSREAMAAYYRSRPAFQAWRQDIFDAFIAYGTVEHEDGTASPCLPAGPSARLYDVMFDFEAWHDIYCPDLPVRVVFGERSPRTMPGHDDVSALRLLFPRAQGAIMQGATHTGPMEHPERFEKMLGAFDTSLDTDPEDRLR
jgi:pimeloyl-ACP methyl ester carboxylesterase